MIQSYRLTAIMAMHHAYYQNDRFHDIDITPMPGTQRYLDQARIQVKQSGNQFSIYSQNNSVPEASGKKWPPLFFYLTVNNFEFLNFSSLPITPGQIFYFANQNGSQQMTRNDFAGKNDLVYYTMPQSRLTLGEHISGKVLIKNSSGEPVKEMMIEHNDHIDLDMGHGVTGYFELWKDEDVLAKLFIDEYYAQRPPFGILSLELNPMESTQTPPTYQLNFDSRKTIWRYFIVASVGANYSDLRINSTFLNTEFTQQTEDKVLPSGESAKVFISDLNSPIPLSSNRTEKITLLSGSDVLINQLPYPGSDRVIAETKNNQTLYFSDVYIYV